MKGATSSLSIQGVKTRMPVIQDSRIKDGIQSEDIWMQ